jgi:hypothetical protein
VFPDGRMILTCPTDISKTQAEKIKMVFQAWLDSDEPYPLMIGDCVVQMAAVRVREVSFRA